MQNYKSKDNKSPKKLTISKLNNYDPLDLSFLDEVLDK
jgi:hypothetical protein